MTVLSGPQDFANADVSHAPLPRLRDVLRTETHESHARLDAKLGELDLHTLDGYRRFLEINAAALFPLEAALADAHVERILPDWDMRSRRRAMLDDLAAVDGKLTPLTVRIDLTPARILGVTYVLEGSRLGARVLLGNVNEASDPTIRQATAFLSHGAGARLWQSFLAILESEGAATDHAEVADGARQAFDVFAKAAGA